MIQKYGRHLVRPISTEVHSSVSIQFLSRFNGSGSRLFDFFSYSIVIGWVYVLAGESLNGFDIGVHCLSIRSEKYQFLFTKMLLSGHGFRLRLFFSDKQG